MKFSEFNLHEKLVEALEWMGFEDSTPIQEQCVPVIEQSKDLLASAQTGTGKTAAFIIPILDQIVKNNLEGTSALIIAPTRELAIQIDQQIQGLSYFLNTTSKAVFGGDEGVEWTQEKKALKGGSNIIVATPGKLITHLKISNIDFKDIRFLVLDEADRMLDIGFHEDILNIISYLPKERQTLLFSATMPPKIKQLANKILTSPETVNTALSKPPENILQGAYLVHDNQKVDLLVNLIGDKPEYDTILIFTSTKKKVQEIVRHLNKKGTPAEGISSDLEQAERKEVLMRFKSRKTRVLVATDVLSRGIDIKEINLVINYDAPGDAEDYVHRIGRTARANTSGVALTFVNKDDMRKIHGIEKLIEQEVPKLPLPEHLGEGPQWQSASKSSGKSKGKKYFNNKKHNKNKGNQHYNKKQ